MPISEWRYQDSCISCSQLQFPSQEDQLVAIHRQDTFVKIVELRGEAEAPPWTTETKNNPT